ncbi:MAG: methyltransferase [Planctomycetaceae bacterium]
MARRRSVPSDDVPKVHAARHALPRGIADRLLLDHSDSIRPGRALLVLVTGTALARHLALRRPEVEWSVFTPEHFYLTAVVNALSELPEGHPDHPQIQLFCTPDLPEGTWDTVVFPTDSKGSAELTRDLLQAVCSSLAADGCLMISTNNAKDHWLHEHLKELFGKITVHRDAQGICYVARKPKSLNKHKDFSCEFAFRDEETLIPVFSRPGVFSHRRLDPGARALVRSLNLLPADGIDGRPIQKIVEMGCGCGAVSTAAALRYPQARVLAVDSHARAVQSTERTAELNHADNVSVLLTADGDVPAPGSHDLFLCNPPYYSDYRISELFLQSALDALRPGGRIHLVTKLTDWHENRMIEIFGNAEAHRFGEYDVIVSVTPSAKSWGRKHPRK